MSDVVINNLQQRVNDLTSQLAEANQESKGRKLRIRSLSDQVAALTAERDGHARTVNELTAERDGLRAQAAAAPGELQKTIQDLQLRLRTRSHQDRFNELATAAGAHPTALEAAWELSGYKAESDDVDDGKLTEAVGKAKTRLPIAFEPPRTGQDAAAAAQNAPLTSGLGGDRGLPERSGSKLRVSSRQLADPAFMSKNQAAIAEASRAGTLDLID